MLVEICILALITALWWLRGILQECNQPTVPELFYKKESPLHDHVVQNTPILKKRFVPPLLWGRFGHWQTLAYGILGNRKSKRWLPKGTRTSLLCKDGATITYDVFEPLAPHTSKEDLTFLVCPGIANSSESVYIRSFVLYAQNSGYRCVVLNHLGVVPDVKLTAPRLFTYGGTAEYASMVDDVLAKYSGTTAIAVGFSMGANVVSCYLSESAEIQKRFLCGISVCQGYDIIRSRPLLLQWQQLRRAYMFSMTRNMKKLFARHRDILFSDDMMKTHPKINMDAVFQATCLEQIDEHFTRFVLGYENLDKMYQDLSCSGKLHMINIPMVFINALDDPIVPPNLLDFVKDHTSNHETSMLVVTRHGGHLGFLEGDSLLMPNPVSWLSRFVVEYSDAVFGRSQIRNSEYPAAGN
ncbi:monoacylglycerol lipase ABHD2-like [Paramacrobiotus metropolitanus]|uniref:monoacylglycerol lipase ABHD2-like n=1 Tax=Paramacrobiotus metropolitanus TaxID=2943436 RepID=UPI002445C521|nr:monoacylglycerol lipase ABHD2-like [Paramacrobiotus metropolitanus]